jgi:hypothetical protein
LDLGPKRSLRKALAAEPDTHQATKGDKKQPEPKKKLSDVSVPGAWSRASKIWNWQERAIAYDLAQMEKRATQIREMVSSAPYASRAYRIIKLDYLARILIQQVKPGMELKWCLALTARFQSLMDDIAKEMAGIDEAMMDACDANAMLTIREDDIKKKSVKSADVSDQWSAAIEKEMERRGMKVE